MGNKRLKKSQYLDEDQELMRDLGPDFYEYFSDSRLGKKDSVTRRTRKVKPRFAQGDQVEVLGRGYGTIILGPYHGIHGENTYEIELEDGEITTQPDDGNTIAKYVPPVEEVEEDEF